MRVLILSANTGGGHNSTAEALAGQFAVMNVECQIMDALSLISEKVSGIVSWGHSCLYKHFPALFGGAYRFEEKHSPRFVYEQCAKGAPALQEKLLSEHFDAVVCVHVFSCMMMTEVRVKYGNRIPNYFVATDYTCSPGVSELKADGYFIPHRMLLGEFVRAMIPADKLIAMGIPVRHEFYRGIEKEEAKQKLGINAEKLLLISCGSIGCGHLERHAPDLLRKLPENTAMIVLCGNNEALYEQLAQYRTERFQVVGFSRQIPLYMSAADLYLTKPGGLMTTEAIAKKLPMVFINAVPGCETRNFEFLTRSGVATGAKNWNQAIDLTVKLLEHPELLQKQRDAMEHFLPGISGELICRYVIRH